MPSRVMYKSVIHIVQCMHWTEDIHVVKVMFFALHRNVQRYPLTRNSFLSNLTGGDVVCPGTHPHIWGEVGESRSKSISFCRNISRSSRCCNCGLPWDTSYGGSGCYVGVACLSGHSVNCAQLCGQPSSVTECSPSMRLGARLPILSHVCSCSIHYCQHGWGHTRACVVEDCQVKHVPSVVVQHPITHYIWSQCCKVAQTDAALSRLKLNQYTIYRRLILIITMLPSSYFLAGPHSLPKPFFDPPMLFRKPGAPWLRMLIVAPSDWPIVRERCNCQRRIFFKTSFCHHTPHN